MIPCPRRNKKDRPLPRLAPITEAAGTFVELDDAVGVLPADLHRAGRRRITWDHRAHLHPADQEEVTWRMIPDGPGRGVPG